MDLTLNADQRDLQAALRDYLAYTWTPERLRSASGVPSAAGTGDTTGTGTGTGDAVDRKDWRALAEMGVFGLTLPETDGGLGLGLGDAVIGGK